LDLIVGKALHLLELLSEELQQPKI